MEMADPYDCITWDVLIDEERARELADAATRTYALMHPEFSRVLTSGERREQYADHYARTIMRLTA